MPVPTKVVAMLTQMDRMITDGQPQVHPLARGPEDPRSTQIALRQPMELVAINAPEVHLNFDVLENLVELVNRRFQPDPTFLLQQEVRYLANLASEAFNQHSNSLQD